MILAKNKFSFSPCFPFKFLRLKDLSDLSGMSNIDFFWLYEGAWFGRKPEWLVLGENLEEPHSMASLGMSNQSVLFFCDFICSCCTVLILVPHLNVILSNAFMQGRGFNTGVILMNLRVLREMNWMEMWKKIAVKELETMQYTQLADQVRQTCTKIAYTVNITMQYWFFMGLWMTDLTA